MAESPAVRVPTPLPQDSVASFTTSKGSVYSYDEDGHTTRYKAATGIEQPKQDLTVFLDLGLRDVGSVALSYLLKGSKNKRSIEVTELQPDGSARIVADVNEISNPDRLSVTTFRRGKILRSKPASLQPRLGAHVYDSRRFEENGAVRTERHLGHKVTSIVPVNNSTRQITS